MRKDVRQCECAGVSSSGIYKKTLYHNVNKYEVFHHLHVASCVVVDHPELRASNHIRLVQIRSEIDHSKIISVRDDKKSCK